MRAPAGLLLGLLGLLRLRAAGAARRPPHAATGGAGRLTGELIEFRECNASSSILFTNWTQRHAANGAIVVDGHLLVTRPAATISRSLVTFTKCTEYGTDCEHFLSVPFGRESCRMWSSKHMIWTPVRERMVAVQPPHRPLGCPLAQGGYALREAALDFDRAARASPYPLQNSVWTIVVQAWGADAKPYTCVFTKGKIIRWAARPGAA